MLSLTIASLTFGCVAFGRIIPVTTPGLDSVWALISSKQAMTNSFANLTMHSGKSGMRDATANPTSQDHTGKIAKKDHAASKPVFVHSPQTIDLPFDSVYGVVTTKDGMFAIVKQTRIDTGLRKRTPNGLLVVYKSRPDAPSILVHQGQTVGVWRVVKITTGGVEIHHIGKPDRTVIVGFFRSISDANKLSKDSEKSLRSLKDLDSNVHTGQQRSILRTIAVNHDPRLYALTLNGTPESVDHLRLSNTIKLTDPTQRSDNAELDIECQDIEVRQAIGMLAKQTHLSYAVAPSVNGRVSLSLKHVTGQDALMRICRLVNASAHLKNGMWTIETADKPVAQSMTIHTEVEWSADRKTIRHYSFVETPFKEAVRALAEDAPDIKAVVFEPAEYLPITQKGRDLDFETAIQNLCIEGYATYRVENGVLKFSSKQSSGGIGGR